MTRTHRSLFFSVLLCAALFFSTGARLKAATATTTTLTASVNPVIVGQLVTYTVTVTDGGSVPLTGPVRITYNGNFGGNFALNSGSLMIATTAIGPPQTLQVVATYLGDANTSPSSAMLSEVVSAGVGASPTAITVTAGINPAYTYESVTYTATVTGTSPTGTVNFTLGTAAPVSAALSGGTATITNSFMSPGDYEITASYSGDSNNQAAQSEPIDQVVTAAAAQPPLQFVPVTPCRVVDTRNANGPFGGPRLGAGQTRSFAIPQGACGIPSTAAAYSLNVTALPVGQLYYLTVWPTGLPRPTVSLLNSDGRIKASATILTAGTSGAVSVFTPNDTDIVFDINGYFTTPSSSTLAFYTVTPCRMVDTRTATGPLGGPYLMGGQTRSFPLLSSNCNIPATAVAYSLNITALPAGPLDYLTVWPTGQSKPLTSTLNAPTGTNTANAAIVPAGTGGSVSVFPLSNTDLAIDVNGYFAPPGVGGTSLFTTTPCRVFDSRTFPFPVFPGTFIVNVAQSSCSIPSTASAYVFSVTVLPHGALDFLTLWPSGTSQPTVSTLNSPDGTITSNMAIVPTNTDTVDAYAPDPTQMAIDISSYFAP